MKYADFLKEKGLTIEGLKDMDVQELAGLASEYNAVKFAELETLIEKNKENSNEEAVKAIDALKTEIQDLKDQQLKQLNDALQAQGVIIKKLSREEQDVKDLGFGEGILKGLTDNKESLLLSKKGGLKEAKDATIRFKVAGDMTIVGNISGGNVPVEQRIAGVNEIARREQTIMDLVSRGTATSNVISWVEEQNEDGAIAGTVEGTAKDQLDFDLVVVSENVKKRAAFYKVSTEMLDDVDFINSKIRNTLIVRLMEDIENQVLNGNNVGQNLNGMLTQSTAFAAGAFALTVDNANEIDVLTVAANQVAIANHSITAHLMHPTDVTKFLLTKASDSQYVNRVVQVGGTMFLDGIAIVKSTAIAAGDYLTANFALDTVWDKGGISIEIGLDGNDFTNNMRTILAEWRGLNLIEGNDTTAFVTGTFAADKAALETV